MTAPAIPPTYNPAIPTAQNNIAESQGDFLINFETMFDAFLVNHIPLNDPTNPGNHDNIQLIEQKVPKGSRSDEIIIYSKKVAGQTDQLYMRYPSNGKEFQISEYQIYQIAPTSTQSFYFTFLPGGIIVYFGGIIPNSNPFNLELNPAICSNIMGVNLGVAGVQTSIATAYPSNITGIEAVGGIAKALILANSTELNIPPPQYYIIFGNI